MAETDDPTADKGLINGAIRGVAWEAEAATDDPAHAGAHDREPADDRIEGIADDVSDAAGHAVDAPDMASDSADGTSDSGDGASDSGATAAVEVSDSDDGPDEFVADEFEIEYPSNEGAPPPSPARRGAVASAFLGAGLALEQVIYGEKRSIPAVVQEADDPLDEGDFDLHLDPDNPADSWARLRNKGEAPVDSNAGDSGG